VARKNVVLAEFTGRTGNFPTVTRTLLAKIPEADGKQSYLYDTCVRRGRGAAGGWGGGELEMQWLPTLPPGAAAPLQRPLRCRLTLRDTQHLLSLCSYTFHYIVERNVTYLCLTDEKNKRRLPFAFLDDIKGKFQAAYAHERIAVAIAFSMNAEFSRIMEDRLNYFNDNPNADSFGKVKGQLEEVKGVMVDNIEKVRPGAAGGAGGPRFRLAPKAFPCPACSPPLASHSPHACPLCIAGAGAGGED